ncbi:MAG: 1-phosphofructokinase [Lachnospiraceae bacterium]|nr:1-phosphofructokinase [Lachnospiraceae bacterium]
MITTITLNASIDKAYQMNEKIENGTVMRVAKCRNSAGGKGLNVARIVKLCKGDVSASGLTGGFNGKYLEELLDQDEIEHHFYHIKGETRSCINILDPCYGSTEYLEPGCLVSQEEIVGFLKEFPAIIKDSSVVTLSGSAPEGMNKNIYKILIDAANKAGKKVILDTSKDLLKQGIEARPFMVKPNQDEIEMLFDIKIKNMSDVIHYAKLIFEKGISYVVISLGKDGALLVCEKGIYQAKPPKVSVVNTVGCGDSMVGAFAVSIEKEAEPEECLKYAAAVATANAMSSETGHFDQKQLEEIFDKVKIYKIESENELCL